MKNPLDFRISILDDNYLYGSFVNVSIKNHIESTWFADRLRLNLQLYTNPVDFLHNNANGLDIAVVDYLLNNDYNGIQVMEELHEKCPDCSVLLISAHTNINTSLLSILKGAQTFIPKDRQAIPNICYTIESILERKIA